MAAALTAALSARPGVTSGRAGETESADSGARQRGVGAGVVLVVLDEAQRIKNGNSAAASGAKRKPHASFVWKSVYQVLDRQVAMMKRFGIDRCSGGRGIERAKQRGRDPGGVRTTSGKFPVGPEERTVPR